MGFRLSQTPTFMNLGGAFLRRLEFMFWALVGPELGNSTVVKRSSPRKAGKMKTNNTHYI